MNKILIDVRTQEEFAVDHVHGAINILVTDLAASALAQIPKDASIVVYCASGGRAERANIILKGMGYAHVVNGINKEEVEKSFLA
jgi:phage shock protein E